MATGIEPATDADALPRSKPPFLRRVRIRNYKSIAFCDVTLEPLTVLVGRNGSGKSNFLDALAFIRDVIATNLTEATQRHGGWRSVLHRSATVEEVSFELELELPGDGSDTSFRSAKGAIAVYGLVVQPTQFGPPVIAREWLRAVDAGGVVVAHCTRDGKLDQVRTSVGYNWQVDHPGIVCETVRHPQPDQSWLGSFDHRAFRDVVEGMRWSGFYNFDLSALQQPQKSIPGSLLEHDGRNLAGVIRDVSGTDPWQVERAGQFLSVVVPEVERFESVPVGGYDVLRFHLRQGDGRPPLDFESSSMSDGTLRALAALMAVYQVHRPSGPHLVGIEEPETALHPAAANALVGALDEATLSTQVIITTHSPDLLDHPDIRPENVRAVRMIDGRTVIGRVDEASIEIVKDGLNTLGGLERDDSLGIDRDDLDRQAELSRNGSGGQG